jgi:toxin ParE1/3/4
MTLVLTDAALADLRDIRCYTLETWGEEQEARYLNLIWEKFKAILASPARFRFRHDLFLNCQIAAVGKHIVFFRIQGDILQVVRVLHGAMDYSRHLRLWSE